MEKKPVIWIGSSKKDLLDLPHEIRKETGHALYIAQKGGKYRNAKPLKGFGGGGVIEIVLSDREGTFRTVYTVEMKEAICVLHVFQKKSKTGIATPKQEIDLIKQRLNTAQQKYKEWLGGLLK